MTIQAAATKSNKLIDEIFGLISDGKKPDQFTLARIKSEINKVLNVDAGNGHGLLGMFACLEADAELCKKHHKLAIQLTNDVVDYINYTKSLIYLGQSNEAYQQIKKVLSVYPHNPDLIYLAIRTAIYSGHPDDVDDYYDALNKIKPDMINTEITYIRSLAKKFRQADISDEIASSLVKLAGGLILKNRLLTFSRNIFTDETGSNIDIYYWIEINANPTKVVEMNIELCEQIAADPYFCDKNTFSIAYQSK